MLGPRKEDLAAAEAGLAAQEAAVAGLEHDIAEGELRAPDAGVIQSRILEPGDMASPQKPVLTLALTTRCGCAPTCPRPTSAACPRARAPRSPPTAIPDRGYDGWVGFISPTAEFTPKSVETPELRTSLVYQVRVFVCDPAARLRLGMPVTVAIASTSRPRRRGPAPLRR